MFKTKKKILASLGAAVLLLGAGCGQQQAAQTKTESAASSYTPVSWTENIGGTELQMKTTAPPSRAVSMSQATTEMLLALDLGDRMAGTAFKEEEIYPPLQAAYEKVPVLAEKWPSYEVFMAAKPDFTTGWEVPFTKRGIEADKITAQNIPIFVPDSMQSTKADLDMVFADMVKFGEIFGVKDRAEAWVADQKKQLAAVQDKIAKLPHKRVFVFDSEDGEPFTVFEGYTPNLLRLIGADNVMSGQGVDKTWSKTSWESVVAADPEYIIIADYSTSIRNEDDFNQKVEKLKENPRLQGTTTVKENHFVRVKLSEITPGVRSVDALKRLAEQIHGVKID